MAKASMGYTGSRRSAGAPTLSRNDYFQLMKKIRKEREKNAETEGKRDPVWQNAEAP